MPRIDPARHAQGIASYRAGHSLAHIFEVFEELRRMHSQPDLTREQHDEIEAAGPSLIAGYADGVIDDIRQIAARQRSGQRA